MNDAQTAQLKTLKAKRKLKKAELTRFVTFFTKLKAIASQTNKFSYDDKIQTEARITNIDVTFDQFTNIQDEIETILNECDENCDAEIKERECFENQYYEIVAQAKSFLINIQGHPAPQVNDHQSFIEPTSYNVASNFQPIKFPEIRLPQFDGEFEKFLAFKDLFTSLIHDNSRLSELQKLHYLKTSLTGNAQELLNNIGTSSGNYDEAWNKLCENFENKEIIAQSHLDKIINIKAIKHESASDIRSISRTIQNNLNSLKMLKLPIESWDFIVIYLIKSKLDPITFREWECFKRAGEFPTLIEFTGFLKDRANMLQKMQPLSGLNSKGISEKPFASQGQYFNKQKDLVQNLSYQHPTIVQIAQGHSNKDCKSKCCKSCDHRHHTLLHYDKPKQGPSTCDVSNSSDSNTTEPIQTSLSTYSFKTQTQALLSTAVVLVTNKMGFLEQCRLLLDSGSQSNFITTEFADKLGLQKKPTNIGIVGINNVKTNLNFKCEATITSLRDHYSIDVSCLLISKICENVPNLIFNPVELNIPRNIELADPAFHVPTKIDMLIGVEVFWSLITAGQISLGPHLPILQKTKLGWLISGPIPYPPARTTICNLARDDIQDNLLKFWELEEVPNSKEDISENDCEQHFISTTKRDVSGRFVVSIPIKDDLSKLGESKPQALKRFYSLEKRFASNSNLKTMYVDFMREYEMLNHMTKLENPEILKQVYYLPHHGVLKENSITRKLRVVFDGSSATTSGHSLNSVQAVGPVIQEDLFSILTRFRRHSIAFSADISKMYRQILINPDQRHLQSILWRSDPSQSLSTYQLNTVTYGTSSASFLAIRCMHQLALESQGDMREAAEIIKGDFYVDDLLSGSEDFSHAVILIQQISEILGKGCFTLRKWVSNSQELLNNFQNFDDALKVMPLNFGECSKTLGIHWDPLYDAIQYETPEINLQGVISKRSILSTLSQVFDPLGLVGPVIITGKILIQQLWLEKLSWDESVLYHVEIEWRKFVSELPKLNAFKIPRHALCSERVSLTLHGFSDASNKAYGACIYLRSIDKKGDIKVNLLCAKSKVSPLKALSIPRLELCAALILAKLLTAALRALRLNDIDQCFLWTDSTIVLCWLKSKSSSLKQFVSNRVSEIQILTHQCKWGHVRTKDNPADLISRGVPAMALVTSQLWWNGPQWLMLNSNEWPSVPNVNVPTELLELKATMSVVALNFESKIEFLNKFSSFTRLQRVLAYMKRFLFNCKSSQQNRLSGPLCTAELNDATLHLIKLHQKICYQKELLLLQKGEILLAN